ncbi:MAG: hypothetical protein QXT43_00375 [Candidatus Micrarchaeaceae archaeon]
MPAPREVKILFVRALSLGDLCRLVSAFQTTDTLFYTKANGKASVAALGERIGKTQLAYYVNTATKGKFVNYEQLRDGERAELSDTAEFIPQTGSKYSINVISADLDALNAKRRRKESVTSIRLDSLLDLAKAAIRHSASNELVPHVYSFAAGTKHIFGAFDLIDELSDDRPAFYFTTSSQPADKAFIAYNYKDDSVTLSDRSDEHEYLYIKIVRLAEAMPYVKYRLMP